MAVAGPALVHAPVSVLRVVVGGVLLVFGLGWLRKAVLRASGLKAKHDEDQIFADRVAELAGPVRAPGTDGAAFAVACKGVFLEGIEVVIIVLTLGSTDAHLGLAAAGPPSPPWWWWAWSGSWWPASSPGCPRTPSRWASVSCS